MKVYLVGGAVRDRLLGLPVAERDWVVVGADSETMRAQGFVPADSEFPVFLHPQTGEEYALARREVKRGEGYRGFAVDSGSDVTLEEDLRRRDLTVNAIAEDADGHLVDPFGGLDDLQARLLRHVSPAFVEDPLRVLRIARFAAKLGRHGFHVAHGTHRLLCQMVQQGEMAHLSRERFWRETVKAMHTGQPWRYLEVLQACGALRELNPCLGECVGGTAGHGDSVESPALGALKRLAGQTDDVVQRLAVVLGSCVGDRVQADKLLDALRADRATAGLVRKVVAARPMCERIAQGDIAAALVDLLSVWRALDGDMDITAALTVSAALYPSIRLRGLVEVALPEARGVTAATLQSSGIVGAALGGAIAKERTAAVARALNAAGLVA